MTQGIIYTLSTWDGVSLCFRAGKRGYPNPKEARESAKYAGRYRVVKVENGVRTDGEPFDIVGKEKPAKVKAPAKQRPTAWR